MTRTRTIKMIALVGMLALAAAACGGNGNSSVGASASGGSSSGGVYRTAIEDFGFTDAFDPTGEYLGTAWGLYSDLLLRNLVSYTHTVGIAGDKILPDMATDTGQLSTDGLTLTFTLKPNVMFGPPLNRAVTSKDVEFAFERINMKSLVAQYGNYYDGVIKGMDGQATKFAPVSGIETPDDSTIVFHLEKPTGDILYRLAMPATSPVPPEVGSCFTKAGDYGRFVISSGPYMIQGEDALDTSSCANLTKSPMSGFDPDKKMVIVQNPAYDASSDSTTIREQNLDGVVISIDTNTGDIFNKVQSGDLDGTWASAIPTALEAQYLTNPDLKPLLHADSGDRTWYITMNFLVPPFDDLAVRKAVNFIIDKQALQKAWGGPVHGDIATSIEPPTVLPATASYDPYPSPNHAGDLAAAQDAMKQSKYDPGGTGKCTDPVCNNVLFLSRNIPPWTDMDPVIVQDLAKIGINVKLREVDTSTGYTTIQKASNLIPISAVPGWGKDYADPYGFDFFIFNSAGVACEGQVNYSELGMTPAQAKDCGGPVLAAWNAATNNGNTPLPSVDTKMNECYSATGDARSQCWADLDKYLMETAVPWVPYLWATAITVVNPSVTHYEFDQFAGAISFAHITVDNGLTVDQVAA